MPVTTKSPACRCIPCFGSSFAIQTRSFEGILAHDAGRRSFLVDGAVDFDLADLTAEIHVVELETLGSEHDARPVDVIRNRVLSFMRLRQPSGDELHRNTDGLDGVGDLFGTHLRSR